MSINQRKRYFVLVISSLILAAMACNFPRAAQTEPTNTPIPVSTAAVESLQNELATAVVTAASGQPVKIEITDVQMTSLVAAELKSQTDPAIDNPQVHLENGQILFTGDVQQSGMTLPLKAVMTVSADSEGQVHYKIVSANLGPFPLPQSLLDQFTSKLDQSIAQKLGSEQDNMVVEDINIGNGVMTVTGHTR